MPVQLVAAQLDRHGSKAIGWTILPSSNRVSELRLFIHPFHKIYNMVIEASQGQQTELHAID